MPSDTRAPLYGLVLAGGESRRMGRDKALLQRRGRTQLEYLYALVDGFVDRTFISARASQSAEAQRSRFPQIIDRYEDIGPLAGILSAMEEYPGVDWLVVACDLPNVNADTLGHLLAKRSATQPFTAFRSSHDGLPEPLCAVYAGGSDAIIRGFAADGVHCPRKIMIRSDTCLLEQPDPRALDNVNTPDDLESSILQASQ
jgi:molybdopterin-guanine dinucleotide biosynthesis protein A